jgi:hypothetical protein
MSERFIVTKSEDPNAFPNYGATTGMDADNNHGKMTAETDAKQPSSSLEETIGRREQKICTCLPFSSGLRSFYSVRCLSVIYFYSVDRQVHLFLLSTIYVLFIIADFSFAVIFRFPREFRRTKTQQWF